MAVESLNPMFALAAGAIAFFSPCVLPIIPGFLGFIAGGAENSRRRQFFLTLAFVLGFTMAFTVIGFLIGAVGASDLFQATEQWLRRIGGTIIIAFGLYMTGLLRVPLLEGDYRFHGKAPEWLGPVGGAAFLGMSFAVGWTPCVGPVLGSIILLAGIEGGALTGALLLFLFSVGLGVPFLLFGILSDHGAAFLARYGGVTKGIEIGGGVFLILLGIMVFTGAANRLLAYLVF